MPALLPASSPSAAPSSTLRRLAPALTVVLSTLLALLGVEAGLRLWLARAGSTPEELAARLRAAAAERVPAGATVSMYGLVRPSLHDDIVYELEPNLDVLFRGQPVRTNRWGLRGPEVERRKPPGVFRVAGLGDSHMFGWGVAQGEPFLDLVGAALQHAAGGGRTIEVLNFAVPGYNTAMEAATLERRALDFAPDLVVLHFFGNDWNLPHFMQPPGELATRGGSLLVDLVLTVAGVERDGEAVGLHEHHLEGVTPGQRRELRQRYAAMKGRQGFLAAMERLAAVARAHRLPVVFVALGSANEPYRTARRAAAEHGFVLVDPQPRFVAEARRRGVEDASWRRLFMLPHDGHPNALAHRLYAAELTEVLRRERLVPLP